MFNEIELFKPILALIAKIPRQKLTDEFINAFLADKLADFEASEQQHIQGIIRARKEIDTNYDEKILKLIGDFEANYSSLMSDSSMGGLTEQRFKKELIKAKFEDFQLEDTQDICVHIGHRIIKHVKSHQQKKNLARIERLKNLEQELSFLTELPQKNIDNFTFEKIQKKHHQSQKEIIQQFIAKGEIKAALDELDKIAIKKQDGDLKNNIVLLRSNLTDIKKKGQLGTGGEQILTQRKNQLIQTILELIPGPQ